MMFVLVILFSLVVSSSSSASFNCSYTSSNNHYYDLSSLTLQNGAYSISDVDNGNWSMNVCANVQSSLCGNDVTPACQYLNGYPYQLGNLPPVFSDLDPSISQYGVTMTYNNGTYCPAVKESRQISVFMICNSSATEPYIEKIEETRACNYGMYFQSSKACPTDGSLKKNFQIALTPCTSLYYYKPYFQPWLFSTNSLTFDFKNLQGKCQSSSLSPTFVDNAVIDTLGAFSAKVTVCNLGVPLANVSITQLSTKETQSFDLPILLSRVSFATVPFYSSGNTNVYAVAGFFSDAANQDSITTGKTHSSNNYQTGDPLYAMVYFTAEYSNQWVTFSGSGQDGSTQCSSSVVEELYEYTGEIGVCVNSTTVSYSYAFMIQGRQLYGEGEVPYVPYFVSICNSTSNFGFLISPSMDETNLWFNSPINV